MMYQELKKRNLPQLRTREEMMEILQQEEYGYLPQVAYSFAVSDRKVLEKRFDSGRVHFESMDFTVTVAGKSHSFPLYYLHHTDGKKRPLIIYLSFHNGVSQYFPVEELSEYNVDYITFCYKEVTADNADFTDGIAPLLLPEGQKNATDCGKIAMWAWCNMRVLDFALSLPGTDENNVMIAGHSRLGKTALFTAMMDSRFRFVYSNMSGCGGDSLAKGSTGALCVNTLPKTQRGENITDITDVCPYWFCQNFRKYRDKNYAEDFDQHYLLASVCPRYVLVASAELDLWADPFSSQLCCVAAGEQWKRIGRSGCLADQGPMEVGGESLDGDIGYFLLKGHHFMSRHGWRRAVKFIEKHLYS